MIGPAGMTIGSLSGAVFGGLIGGTTFGVAGAKLGTELDQKMLDNYACCACDCTFRPDAE
jgi:hypothetical protein